MRDLQRDDAPRQAKGKKRTADSTNGAARIHLGAGECIVLGRGVCGGELFCYTSIGTAAASLHSATPTRATCWLVHATGRGSDTSGFVARINAGAVYDGAIIAAALYVIREGPRDLVILSVQVAEFPAAF